MPTSGHVLNDTGLPISVVSGFGLTKLGTVTGVDGKSVAMSDIFTCPAGKQCIPLYVFMRETAKDTLTVGPTVALGFNSGGTPYTNIQVASLVSLGTFSSRYVAFGGTTFLASGVMQAGEVLKANITIGATATTLTLAFDVFGYIF